MLIGTNVFLDRGIPSVFQRQPIKTIYKKRSQVYEFSEQIPVFIFQVYSLPPLHVLSNFRAFWYHQSNLKTNPYTGIWHTYRSSLQKQKRSYIVINMKIIQYPFIDSGNKYDNYTAPFNINCR